VRFERIGRTSGAFQESVSAEQIVEMGRRAFGTEVVSAVELGGGLYNNTYRVDIDADRPVILRVAPEPRRQYRIERALMRNEYVSLPFFAPIAAMMPRTLFADWTHELVGRDYVWQSMLDGVSAMDGLKAYPRPQWAGFYRQLGTLAHLVHTVRGERFGPVAGPNFATWSEAVLALLENTAADLEDAGLDAGDVRSVAAVASQRRVILDEIKEPRLLHGDLWVPNVMLDADAPEPTITGVLDHDRASWGDPAADWTSYVVGQRAERAPFWKTYGLPEDTPAAAWRGLLYQALHTAAVRLEQQRLGLRAKIPANYEKLGELVGLLSS
jgi:aminoglycoside phosphotransferase (APT) family kinase protein